MKKRIRLILSLAIIMLMIPVEFALAADESEGISYCDAEGNVNTCTDYEIVKSGNTEFTVDADMWLVFEGEEVTLPKLTINGERTEHTVNLIIRDGQTVTLSNGVSLGESISFVIYGQQNGSGKLNAYSGSAYEPGMGGRSCYGITINGGIINATSSEAAAIGNINGSITINGGSVTGTASAEGAGIGSGSYSRCGDISINVGSVSAQSKNGAGIGAGSDDDGSCTCGNITINGGNVIATSKDGAGIGAGKSEHSTSECGNITGMQPHASIQM